MVQGAWAIGLNIINNEELRRRKSLVVVTYKTCVEIQFAKIGALRCRYRVAGDTRSRWTIWRFGCWSMPFIWQAALPAAGAGGRRVATKLTERNVANLGDRVRAGLFQKTPQSGCCPGCRAVYSPQTRQTTRCSCCAVSQQIAAPKHDQANGPPDKWHRSARQL